jgi:hypothetical protein
MSDSSSQEYQVLLPFERKAIPEHYRPSYMAKRQNFFSNIQETYGLWRYFQLLDRNLQSEFDHIGSSGSPESAVPLAVCSKAHAKIRVAIELAFARCIEEARSIMRDAIQLAICAHHMRADAKLQEIWRGNGDSVPANDNFSRVFEKGRKTTLFKGQLQLYSRWTRLCGITAHAAPHFPVTADDGNCKPVIFDLLLDVSLIEKLIFNDYHLQLRFDVNLLRNRAEAELLRETLQREFKDKLQCVSAS